MYLIDHRIGAASVGADALRLLAISVLIDNGVSIMFEHVPVVRSR